MRLAREDPAVVFTRTVALEMSVSISRAMAWGHLSACLKDDFHEERCVCFGPDGPSTSHADAVLAAWGRVLDIASRVCARLAERERCHVQRCVCFTPAVLNRLVFRLSSR